MILKELRSFPSDIQALICIGVLLDGREAVTYLENDVSHGAQFASIAKGLAAIDPKLRMPLLGTVLRAYREGK